MRAQVRSQMKTDTAVMTLCTLLLQFSHVCFTHVHIWRLLVEKLLFIFSTWHVTSPIRRQKGCVLALAFQLMPCVWKVRDHSSGLLENSASIQSHSGHMRRCCQKSYDVEDHANSHLWMWPVRIRHSSHEIATQSSHFVDRGGWQAKMASIEFWIHDVYARPATKMLTSEVDQPCKAISIQFDRVPGPSVGCAVIWALFYCTILLPSRP